LSILLIAARCNDTGKTKSFVISRAFYYWKSIYHNNALEQATLQKLRTEKIYIKYFDVDWNYDDNRSPEHSGPLAQIQFQDKPRSSIEIIPCVFITNRCMNKTDSAEIPGLAANIAHLISGINTQNNIDSVKELQIDCDWTENTSDKYFYLLKELKKQPYFQNRILSVTIRFFQVKFKKRTGVPPADKGLLMVYNMGNLKDPGAENSVLDNKLLEEYAEYLTDYPLKLDIALPLFGWYVWFQQGNRYKGLIHDYALQDIEHMPADKNGNRYIFKSDYDIAGFSFRAGDMLRKEESTTDDIIRAGEIISRYLKKDSTTLSCFHLDSVTLSKYSADDLEKIFTCLKY
jgi:hypothetical protein